MKFDENQAASRKYVKSKTAVWWDIDSCPVPDGYDARRAAGSIECALKDLNYNGPLTITAVGNMEKIPNVLRELCSAGIKVKHSHPETTSRVIFSDQSSWQDLNPAPATMMFISDKVTTEMTYALCKQQQQLSGYNFVLAYPYFTGDGTILHTTAQWVWKDLLAANEQRETKGHCYLGESSASSLFCTSCEFTGQSLENFITHLSSEEHAQEEIDMIKCRAPPEETSSDVMVEPPPKSKRLRKASRTDCSLLGYHLAKSKRLKKAFWKDCDLLQDHLAKSKRLRKAFRKDCDLLQDHLGRLHAHLGRLLPKRCSLGRRSG